jgi:NADH-quinone oxidoreductase subunit F
VLDEIEAAGLRGRGGAWFPTARKWRSIAAGGAELGDRYVVANGAEGEPGSFKDRLLMRRNPYQVLEGLVVAARVVGARHAYLGLKASFGPECEALERAFAEMTAAGWIGDVPVTLVRGPDEYLLGEEKALLEVIEGEDPLPRFFPPYVYGLFTTAPQMGWSAGVAQGDGDAGVARSNPTLVNNVETLAHVPPILSRGADWYRSVGTPTAPGPTLVTVSGDTVRADVAEVPVGATVRAVIDEVGGGMPLGRSVQAVLSGVANPVLDGARLDVPMTPEDLDAAGAGIGACGLVVYDDTRDMVAVAHSASRFLSVESCGQCPPCKWGTAEVTRLLDRLLRGDGGRHDVDLVRGRLEQVTDANRCALGLEERLLVTSVLDTYPDQVDRLLSGLDAPVPEPPVAKIVDVVDGVAVLDDRQWSKRPDWTYAEEPRRRA